MNFKKIALASAIAMVPAVGFSAEALEDAFLSGVTGQDGIEINVVTPTTGITGDVIIHDMDGLAGTSPSSTYSFAGAIVIDSFGFIGNLDITIDAGDSALTNTAPTLNINVSIPSATLITGDIRVANSNRDDVGNGWLTDSMSAPVLSTMTIALTTVIMNIQLANEPQGNMIALNTSITSGLTISNFALNDAGGTATFTGGSLGAVTTEIVGAGGTALGINMGINASNAGLVIEVGTLGNASGIDIHVTDAYLGTTGAGIVGDVAVLGLNLNGSVITVSGK